MNIAESKLADGAMRERQSPRPFAVAQQVLYDKRCLVVWEQEIDVRSCPLTDTALAANAHMNTDLRGYHE